MAYGYLSLWEEGSRKGPRLDVFAFWGGESPSAPLLCWTLTAVPHLPPFFFVVWRDVPAGNSSGVGDSWEFFPVALAHTLPLAACSNFNWFLLAQWHFLPWPATGEPVCVRPSPWRGLSLLGMQAALLPCHRGSHCEGGVKLFLVPYTPGEAKLGLYFNDVPFIKNFWTFFFETPLLY